MSKKDTLLAMLKSAGVEKLYYNKGFDFEADHPDGKMLIYGSYNDDLVLSVYGLYFDDDCCPIDHQDLVVDMALPDDRFYDFFKNGCEEVLYVSI